MDFCNGLNPDRKQELTETFMKTSLLILFLAVFSFACAPQGKMDAPPPAPADKPAEPEKKSIARETINGFTGKTAVDRYKDTKEKIAPANERGRQSKEEIDLLTK